MQAANTGLTGGSTPDGYEYDRDIVIINTMRLDKIYLIDEGRQAVCLPGATLFKLEELLQPLGRNPHSVIGSSCIGASVFGGVCNNSGGALIHRGPAYTQMTLYAQIDDAGNVELVNHLGIQLGGSPEEILLRLEQGNFTEQDIRHDPDRSCSDHEYQQHVRDIGATTPARFNADPRRLYEASGSAGKVMLFAVRLDTFPKEAETRVFYIGTNDPSELTDLRRHILANFSSLPTEGEYIHRDAFDIAEKYGKDTFLSIQYLGTARLPAMFALKGWFDSFCSRLQFMPHDLSDRIMQAISSVFPNIFQSECTSTASASSIISCCVWLMKGLRPRAITSCNGFQLIREPILNVHPKRVRKHFYIDLQRPVRRSAIAPFIEMTCKRLSPWT